jgi:RNA polymerase sigma-70 factor (ECF subfamily)
MARRDRSRLLAAFQDHYAAITRFLTRRMGSADRAAEVSHDTYIRLATMEPPGEEIANPRSYAFRVAGNLATDRLRQEQRTGNAAGSEDALLAMPDERPGPEETLQARARLNSLDAALATLSPKARQALLLSRVEGLTHAEVAARLKVSESMVAKYLAQALRHCRDALRAEESPP